MSSSNYRRHLNAAQNETIDLIRAISATHAGGQGWTVVLMPTTRPAIYCELRHYLIDGRVVRWVIERDGSISSHNDQGMRSEMSLA